MLESSVKEFSELEEFIRTLENYIGVPYLWSIYRIVVMPGSFPYGGMENPLLTFASPTLIVGDKSQTDIAIHEIAHSWAGNLVSCSKWACLWLNEGLTVFLEQKAVKLLRNSSVSNAKRYLRNLDLKEHIALFGESHSYTSLCPDIQHTNPDDSFSRVPYFKGSDFLEYVEGVVGEQAF